MTKKTIVSANDNGNNAQKGRLTFIELMAIVSISLSTIIGAQIYYGKPAQEPRSASTSHESGSFK